MNETPAPEPWSLGIVKCPSCDHGIDPHSTDRSICGVGDVEGNLCQCRWTPNEIAGVQLQRARDAAVLEAPSEPGRVSSVLSGLLAEIETFPVHAVKEERTWQGGKWVESHGVIDTIRRDDVLDVFSRVLLAEKLRDSKPLEVAASAVGARASWSEANLGAATTEELLREVIARFSIPQEGFKMDSGLVHRSLVLAEMIGSLSAYDREYRTVDS
ncbi:MAG: hypothetical protein RLZZ403_841 [Pseudomonadota bacterium]|jgi:hypothetical protein